MVEENAHAALQTSDHGYLLETGEVVLQGPVGCCRFRRHLVKV